MKFLIFLTYFTLFSTAQNAWAKTVRYELVTTKTPINLSGKKTVDFALQVNSSIPAPTLEFTEGDDAVLVVRNEIPDDELSIHWHGILLPPEMDGVPYVNTPPIRPGESFTFRFKVRQNGTYWYHSHTNVQEQKGVYGAIVIHPKNERIRYDKEAVLVLSDWSDENATDILKNLRKDGDYYQYKKGTIRSWFGAIAAGGLGTYLANEWTRMGGMDFSDVGYDAFLINGKRDSQLITAHPGEKIRLRVINAAASSYFTFALGEAPMTVISADGQDIKPTKASEVLIGMAETYDILFTVPDHKNYEFRATAQDGTGHASAWVGMSGGSKIFAPDKPAPDLYTSMNHSAMPSMGHGDSHSGHNMMKMNHASMDHKMGHDEHKMPEAMNTSDPSMSNDQDHKINHSNHSDHKMKAMDHADHGMQPMQDKAQAETSALDLLTVSQIRSPHQTSFPSSSPRHDVKLVLGGDMDRYIWHINGKAIHEDRTIEIKENDIVRFTFVNETMMHHPMHLHGHFFRVLNSSDNYSPLKHTVDVAPMATQEIEFKADEPGEWMLHCHNLFHLKAGMARVVKYSSFTPSSEIQKWQKQDPHDHDHWYFYGTAEAATNHGQLYLRTSQTWNQFEARVEGRNTTGTNFSFKEPWEVESDLFYRRWFNRYLNLVGGGTVFDETISANVGISYLLPLLIESQILVSHRGKFRLDLEKRFQWTSHIFTDVDFTWRPNQARELGEDLEFEISLMYAPSWSWSAGLMLTDNSFGAGAQIQF